MPHDSLTINKSPGFLLMIISNDIFHALFYFLPKVAYVLFRSLFYLYVSSETERVKR